MSPNNTAATAMLPPQSVIMRASMIRLRFLLFAALLALGPSPSKAETDGGPAMVVTAFHDTLLGVMKDAKALGVKGRYEKLAQRIEQSFHLALMAQVSAGASWRKATKAQTDKLVAAFSRLSISTYASQFDGWSGQSFSTKGEKPGPQKTVLVMTQIIDPGSDPVDLTYVTRRIKGQWRIIDVLLDTGISELAVRRSEYRRVLKTGGIEALADMLNAKSDQLLNE